MSILHKPNPRDLLWPLSDHLPTGEATAFAWFYIERAIATVRWEQHDDWAILVSLSTRTVRWKTPAEDELEWGRRLARAPIPRWTQPFEFHGRRWLPSHEVRLDRRCVHFHLPPTIPDRDFYAAMNIVNPLGESTWSAGDRTLFGPCRRGPEWGADARTWVMNDLELGHDRIADPPELLPAA